MVKVRAHGRRGRARGRSHALRRRASLRMSSLPLKSVLDCGRWRCGSRPQPDGVQRGLVGEIVRRFEAKGFRLAALKLVQVGSLAARRPRERNVVVKA